MSWTVRDLKEGEHLFLYPKGYQIKGSNFHHALCTVKIETISKFWSKRDQKYTKVKYKKPKISNHHI